MRTLTILKGVAALVLLTSFGAANAANELPSPCGAGQTGAGTNCLYLSAAGATYDATTGERTLITNSLTVDIEVWMDFGSTGTEGGGFDILSDGNVSSMNWQWMGFFDGFFNANDGCRAQTGTSFDSGAGCDPSANNFRYLQFDDFSTSDTGGFGPGRDRDAFAHVGTLTVTFAAAGIFDLSLYADEYATNTFPNCFLPEDGQPCTPTNYFGLTVDASSAAVPLPAAVWMMLAGLGTLGGFSRRRA